MSRLYSLFEEPVYENRIYTPLTPELMEDRMKLIVFQCGEDHQRAYLMMTQLMAAQLEALGYDAAIDLFREQKRYI